MPRIPDIVLNTVFFLYPTKEAAEKGENFGGSGFIVTVPSSIPGRVHAYGITNAHVAPGSPVVRINRKDTPLIPDIFEFQDIDWEAHPDFYDIAATPLLLDPTVHDVAAIPVADFASPERSSNMGLGDDVFMAGRFVDHDGGTTNKASVRFGNIAVMPTLMPQRSEKPRESYIIDLHSRTGYSGSPVHIYRTLGGDLDAVHKDGGNLNLSKSWPLYLHLLGIHWCQFDEWLDVYKDKADAGLRKPPIGLARGYSGMTCVIPAKHILELLNMPKFQAQRAEGDAAIDRSAAKADEGSRSHVP